MGVSERTTAAQATIRQPKVKVVIDWTDPYLDASLSTTTTDTNRVSYSDQVGDSLQTAPYKWAHCDGTTTIGLGNELHPMPGDSTEAMSYQVGWWGETACDGSGNFSTPYPSLTINFSQRSVYELLVAGDDKYNEYPVNFVVTVYDVHNIVLYSASVTGNTDLIWTYDVTSQNITTATKMTLVISKWSTASRVVKITEFYNRVITTYTGDDIVSASLLEESEVKRGSLPQGNISANEMDLELQNVTDSFFPDNSDSSLANFMKPGRKITLYFGWVLSDGSTEYETMGTFWSGDWDLPETGTTAKVTARDRMELLRQRTYTPSQVYQNATIYYLLNAVLSSAQSELSDISYTIDSELDGTEFVVPYAVLKRDSYFKVLQTICQAGSAFCYVSRDDVVTIVGPTAANAEEASYYEITKDMYTDLQQPSSYDTLYNVIEVPSSPLAEGSEEQVYISNEAIELADGETKTVTLKYSLGDTDKAVLDAAASLWQESSDTPALNATVTSATYYYWGADVTVYTATAENVRVRILGKKLSLTGQETVVSRNEQSILDYGELTYAMKENPLVQTRELATKIADTLVDVYHYLRKDITVDWFGDTALAVGDDFRVPTYQKNGIDNRAVCKVIKNKVDYSNGSGFRMTTTGKKLLEAPYESEYTKYQDTDGASDTYQDTDSATTLWQDGDES